MAKKHEGTFADLLINRGIAFHPETVLIDVSEVVNGDEADAWRLSRNSGAWDDPDLLKIETPTIPPFNHVFVYYRPDYKSHGMGAYDGIYFTKSDSSALLNSPLIMKHKNNPALAEDLDKIAKSNLKWWDAYEFNESSPQLSLPVSKGTSLCWNEAGNFIFALRRWVNYIIRWPMDDLIGFDNSKHPAHKIAAKGGDIFEMPTGFRLGRVMYGLSHLHQKHPIEFVDYPRHVRSQIEHETGKEPSPFFMLRKNPTAKQIRYKNLPPKGGKAEKAEIPLTWVIGHFATQPSNHPLPQFAGKTFWIPAHTRGDKKFGEVKKGYYIRQPKEKAVGATANTDTERAKQDFDNFVRNTGSMMQKWGDKI